MRTNLSVYFLGFLSGLAVAAVIGWQRQPTGAHAAYMRDEYGHTKREIWIDGIEEEILRRSI